jgi:hypothetical protein
VLVVTPTPAQPSTPNPQPSTPRLLLQVGKESKRTLVAFNSHAPVFNTSFEFFNVTGASELKVQVSGRGICVWGGVA